MDYSNLRVLLTEGGSRQTLPMARAFRELGCQVTTLNDDSFDLGNISKYPTKKIVSRCSVKDYEGTKNAIYNILSSEKYDLVVPLSDFTATLMAKEKEYFSRYAIIAVNDWDTFIKASDKLNTMSICMENGIPCPRTYFEVESMHDLERVVYPVVIKPRSACGSIGFNVAENAMELERILLSVKDKFGPMFVQEYIPQTGKQFNAHMFLDANHEVKTALVAEKCRWFPVDGGASTLCVTVNRPDIVSTCSKLLKEMEWVGYCDVDLILDPRDGIPKVIEVNARISANVKICYLAGFNIAKQILQNEFGEKVIGYHGYNEDIRLRCLHTDLLWFLKSEQRFSSKPSWFSFKNTSDQVFSISDPFPWFAFSIQALGRYREEMSKRSRELP